MPRLLISYRRADPFSVQLADCIDRQWSAEHGPGSVFLDVRTCQPGLPFDQQIDQALNQVDAVLALMGPGWAEEFDRRAAQADGELDWVRRELAHALDRIYLPVVPVRLPGAAELGSHPLPAELAALTQRQGAHLANPTQAALHAEVAELLRRLHGVIANQGPYRFVIQGHQPERHPANAALPQVCLLTPSAAPANALPDWWPTLRDFIRQTVLPAVPPGSPHPLRLRLDAGYAIGFAAGALLHPQAGVAIELEQRQPNSPEIIWPIQLSPQAADTPRLHLHPEPAHPAAAPNAHWAVALSVTHRIDTSVRQHLKQHPSPAISQLIHAHLPEPSPNAVRDGGHASALAWQLASELHQLASAATPRPRLHLFIAAPITLAFCLGQYLRRLLLDVTIYEHQSRATPAHYLPTLTLNANDIDQRD